MQMGILCYGVRTSCFLEKWFYSDVAHGAKVILISSSVKELGERFRGVW